MKRLILAISGASGIVYAIRLLEFLIQEHGVDLIISQNSMAVIKSENFHELIDLENMRDKFSNSNLNIYSDADITAPTASGSYRTDGMFIVPCSMKTLSAIANGYADNLITRTADVMIKEGRKLIISPREMPFSSIHLENMLKLARIGVVIAPPIPAFYHKPETIDDIIDFVVGKLLDCMGIENNLYRRWNG